MLQSCSDMLGLTECLPNVADSFISVVFVIDTVRAKMNVYVIKSRVNSGKMAHIL